MCENTKKEEIQIYATLVSFCKEFRDVKITRESTTFGRRPDCNEVLSVISISQQHFIILVPKSNRHPISIKDVSANGTFVNGVKIGKGATHTLKTGDQITVVTKRWQSKLKGTEEVVPSYMFTDMRVSTMQESIDEIFKYYDLREELGSGNFGTVRLAFNRTSGEAVAIKIFQKKRLKYNEKEKENIVREIQILRTIHHENIIDYKDFFEGKDQLYLVMEYAAGGELMDLVEKGKISESYAKKLFKELVSAVHYLHSQNIAHRDLKPENILLDINKKIKLSDFGLARATDRNSMMKTQCGTPQYLAPEVINLGMENGDAYSIAVDMWSLGCILYLLLTNKHPFDGEDTALLFKSITTAKLTFPTEPGSTLSTDARTLISRLLDVNPITRITAEDVLKHPWLNSTYPSPSSSTEIKLRQTAPSAPGLENQQINGNQSHKRKHTLEQDYAGGKPEQKKSRPTPSLANHHGGGTSEKGRNSKI